MAKLPKSLRFVDSRRAGGCQKPSCEFSGTLHRHHIRHEAMWLGIWSGRRATEQKWKEFVDRYHAFLPEDYVVVCPNHHAEIHRIYDQIIIAHKRTTRRRLAQYSWANAEDLMSRFAITCKNWLETRSPGIDNEKFAEQRRKKGQ